MMDLAVGLGLALVLEGLLWALAPSLGRRMAREMSDASDSVVRPAAWCMVAAGVAIVWAVRG
ncbi:MAG: DUF2065 domain-containing protein [Hyphomicrobium sp.]